MVLLLGGFTRRRSIVGSAKRMPFELIVVLFWLSSLFSFSASTSLLRVLWGFISYDEVIRIQAMLTTIPSTIIPITRHHELSKWSSSLPLSLSCSSQSQSSNKFTFHIAPMQGYTNAQTRHLFHLLSPSSIKWTEMEKLDDIFPATVKKKKKNNSNNKNNDNVEYLFDALEKRGILGRGGCDTNTNGIPIENTRTSTNNHKQQQHLVLQIGTNDPERLKACIEHVVQRYNDGTTTSSTTTRSRGASIMLQEINLNCGCPSIESGGASTYGASLMNNTKLTGELVNAAVSSVLNKSADRIISTTNSSSSSSPSINVSVKCRIGIFENTSKMRPLNIKYDDNNANNNNENNNIDDHDANERDYKYLKEYVSTIYANGATHVVLHARPAVLSGLSPVKNRIIPELNYNVVRRIAADFQHDAPSLQVTLNGGITSISQLKSLAAQPLNTTTTTTTNNNNNSSSNDTDTNSNGTVSSEAIGITSFMAGRWCLRRPLDLVTIESWLNGEEEDEDEKTDASLQQLSSSSSSLGIIQDAIKQYVDDAIATTRNSSSRTCTTSNYQPTLAEICLPLFLITEQLQDDYKYYQQHYYNDDENEEEGTSDISNNKVENIDSLILDYESIELLYDVLFDAVKKIEELANNANSGGKKKKNNNIKNRRSGSSNSNDDGRGSSVVNFNRVSSSIKSLVGTKVANKWKRNRAEL